MSEMYGDHGPQKKEYREIKTSTQGHGSLEAALNHEAKLGWNLVACHFMPCQFVYEVECICLLERACPTNSA